MPIVIKPHGSDSVGDLIRRFKKAVAITDIVQKAKDRAVYQKPSRIRATKTIAHNRLQKRARTLKRMKNISPQVLQRISERLNQ